MGLCTLPLWPLGIRWGLLGLGSGTPSCGWRRLCQARLCASSCSLRRRRRFRSFHFDWWRVGVAWFPLGPRDVWVPSYHVSPVYMTNVNVTNSRVINRTEVTNVYNTTVINNNTTVNV